MVASLYLMTRVENNMLNWYSGRDPTSSLQVGN